MSSAEGATENSMTWSGVPTAEVTVLSSWMKMERMLSDSRRLWSKAGSPLNLVVEVWMTSQSV